MNRDIYIGKKYGRLTMLKFCPRVKDENLYVNTLCDCGKEKMIQWNGIKYGNTKSCGCLRKEMVFYKNINKGEVYGRLKIIERYGTNKERKTTWRCECSCGKIIIVTGKNLRGGNTKSCGCYRTDKMKEAYEKKGYCFKDLTGEKFGGWTVIKKTGKDKYGTVTWLCKCICGKLKEKTSSILRYNFNSCGCSKKLIYGEASFNALFKNLKTNAYKRSYCWELTKEQLRVLTKQNCYYCGVEPKQKITGKGSRKTGSYIYNGIDRKDNNIGYIMENCVASCGYCNKLKHTRSEIDFREWIERVYENYILKNKKLSLCA